MKKTLVTLIFMACTLFLSGCEEKAGYATFDVNDPSSFDEMAQNLTRDEIGNLVKNMELISHAYQSEKKLHGMSLEQITQEASNIKEWLKKQNQEFLESYITKLQNAHKTEAYLHITKHSRLYEPKEGYVYDRSYSIDELQEIVKYGGDFEAYSTMQEFASGFFQSCLQSTNETNCRCILNKLSTQYNYEALKGFAQTPTQEYNDFLKNSALACVKGENR